MSQVPTTTRITREELQGDAEQQVEAMLRPLNLFFEDVSRALDRDLTVQENMDASVLTVRIQTGPAYPADWVPIRFQHGMKRRPSGSMLVNIVDNNDFDTIFTSVPWMQVRFDSKQGEILSPVGLAINGDYNITLLIL